MRTNWEIDQWEVIDFAGYTQNVAFAHKSAFSITSHCFFGYRGKFFPIPLFAGFPRAGNRASRPSNCGDPTNNLDTISPPATMQPIVHSAAIRAAKTASRANPRRLWMLVRRI
jgi:hypothetical protein